MQTYDEWAREVRRLAGERRAVILAHNYQVPWIQDVADFVGDSLALSRQAAVTDAETIVFCGVHFMAETAKILSPDKTVLLPDLGAGCSLAATITAEDVPTWNDRRAGSCRCGWASATSTPALGLRRCARGPRPSPTRSSSSTPSAAAPPPPSTCSAKACCQPNG